MRLKELDLDTYLFGIDGSELEEDVRERIHEQLENEVLEIFYGRNIT
jgi:S-adenosylmethionine decarboxylase